MTGAEWPPSRPGAIDVAMTGAGGFLGWHTRAALLEAGSKVVPVRVGTEFVLAEATRAMDGAARLIHVAGINKAPEDEILAGNIGFADQTAEALLRADVPPPVVVYANSTQATNGSAYGDGKAKGADILAAAAQAVGAEFIDLKLPNLFGEHGKPFYNSVAATFCHLISRGAEPTVERDRELTLLHVQNAADLLTGAVARDEQQELQSCESVSGLLKRLTQFAHLYGHGEIPDIANPFDRDLFNTYRSFAFSARASISLAKHADARGAFYELIRTHGGAGQSSFSTTVPEVTRGDHFHRRKVERFVVLSGRARISLRKVLTNEMVTLNVSGDYPVAVDMPTMWAHNLTNTGSKELFTLFWTNDLFDENHSDTISEVV